MKKNVIELIGKTPIVNISKIDKNIFVKLENKNPGGSIKDRAVLGMILGMEERGKLISGDRIVEATSGNTGIATAMIGKSRGYDVTIIMPESMSQERRALIRAFGAELILTEASKGMQGTIDKMNELLSTGNYKSLGQFNNKDNPDFHYKTTGPEIFEDIDDLDIFVAGIGTGGTVSGIGKYLKEKNPNIKIFGVEPEASPLINKNIAGPHKIQGIGANFIPKNLDLNIIDEVILITDDEAFDMMKRVSNEEGIMLGISSGANIAAAKKLAERFPGKKIVTVAPDGAEKYMSMNIF
ncbi:cysteine synthase A [Peptostreptococcus canis]|uniref:Cysteine synthase A n=1 Tax=Peptostreptococcus canis TaxID=1159213 RepID=A0ABR6TMS1_9FIRM|nr:cysteine synthase A [Peptostreptococcus canis]MBC2576707.1 cysteine synthase A [Peptostreptococcus canis]MBP1998444.1 cysteine synthase A [Peptostreptococcus canis]